MSVVDATPDVITKRVADICLTLPEVRTRIEYVRALSADELIAVYVLPDEKCTRKLLTLPNDPSPLYEVTREYTIFVICTRAEGKGIKEELAAVKAAYPHENLIPKLFARNQTLSLNGNDGIVFRAKMPSDDGPMLAPISNNTDRYGMWKYTMPVTTIGEG